MSNPLRVTVVGAGLGGLAAAVSLIERSFDVTVIEQADELGEIGAGVQLSPNAMKVLRALGLEDKAIAVGFEPDRHVVRSHRSGRILSQTPLKKTLRANFGAGYYGFHRSDLHGILRAAVPAGVIRLGARCVAVRSEPDRALVELADGSRHEADVVVGADGVHSVVRAGLLGPESPRFTGNVCWRGLVPAGAMPAGAIPPDMTVWFGPRASFIAYYVRRGELINWVAMCEADAWKAESWKLEGDRREVMERYAAWHPTVRELIARSDLYLKWALLDRDPLPRWSEGRVTLLGDAAHPMLPYLAQGACMAIEDGYAIAARLAQSPSDVPAALQAYEGDRRERTARVQMLARARAIENHLDSPLARMRRNLRYAMQRIGDPKRHTYRIEWIYGHDVTAV